MSPENRLQLMDKIAKEQQEIADRRPTRDEAEEAMYVR